MIKNNIVISIIPARGGSKRIPGKNKYKFLGQPLVEWSIKSSLLCDYIDETIISSDDNDILKIGEKYNIKLHQRSKELSTDEASSFDLIKDIYFNLLNKKADIIIALQPTSPLREKDLLNNSLQHICSFGGWSSAIELFSSNQFTGKIINNYWMPDFSEETRSQELPKSYVPSGRFFAYKCKETIEVHDPFGEKVLPLFTDEWKNINIDDYRDIEKMDFIYNKYEQDYSYLLK